MFGIGGAGVCGLGRNEKGERELTSRRRENGRHALKVSLLRKLVINWGQLGSVKLSPKLLSKGLGRGLGLKVPEAVVPLVDAEPATVVDVAE